MEENKLNFFTITGEDGNEYDFLFVEEIECEGKKYWICDEAIRDEKNQEIELGDSVAFRVEKSEENPEDFYLDSIEDEAEYEKVQAIWEKSEKELNIDEDLDLKEFEEK